MNWQCAFFFKSKHNISNILLLVHTINYGFRLIFSFTYNSNTKLLQRLNYKTKPQVQIHIHVIHFLFITTPCTVFPLNPFVVLQLGVHTLSLYKTHGKFILLHAIPLNIYNSFVSLIYSSALAPHLSHPIWVKQCFPVYLCPRTHPITSIEVQFRVY